MRDESSCVTGHFSTPSHGQTSIQGHPCLDLLVSGISFHNLHKVVVLVTDRFLIKHFFGNTVE